MVGLIVAVLVEELEDKFGWVAELRGGRIDEGGPLRAEEDSHDSLKLRRL